MIRKFATLAVLDAQMWDATRRTAHRATFAYTPRQGFLYVRSRAISSRTNDNFDHFPADEIKTAYRSFVGKPVFVNHHNSDHRRARGVIIDAALHKDRLGDGQDDTWVEVLMEIDAERYPKLARAILAGEIERTSMGCDVAYSICSVCNNRAATPLDYCKHIPAMKGQKIRRVTASGTQEDVLVFEKCYGLKFFENSVLVEDPADPTAEFVGVDDRGVGGGYTGGLGSLNVSPTAASSNQVDHGNTLDDLKVFSCARSGVAPAPRALDPDLCPGTGMPLDNPQRRLQVPCPVCGKSVKAADQRTGRTRKDIPRHKPATTAALRAPQGVRMTASKLAYGETVAPRQVSTLRDDSCPVCGEVTGFNGERCMTCGYFKPPDEFMDPDLTKAKEVDLRQGQEESDEIDAQGDSDDVFNLDDPVGDPADAGDVEADQISGEVTSGPTTPAEEGAEKAADDQEAPLDLKGQESPAPDPAPGRQVADEDVPELKGTVFELAKPEEEVQEPAQPDPAPAPPEQDEGGDDSASEDDDDQEDDESSPPKKPKKQSTRRNRGESMRPTLKALAEQQIMLEANKKAISTIAALAGVDVSRIYAQAERRIASLQRRADAENPAQPLPEPSAEAPSESSDEALGNLNDADVTSVGTVTEDDGLSGTTVDVTAVGEVMADETAATADVTAPTSGAAMEDQDATLQGDVTARGLDAENAFPIEPAFAAAAQNRVFASLRLARLRLQAGIAQGDDLALSEQIAKSAMTDESIRHEIGTLSAVTRTASASPRQSVPMTREVRRAVPSLGATASSGTPAAIGGSNPAIEDSFLFD